MARRLRIALEDSNTLVAPPPSTREPSIQQAELRPAPQKAEERVSASIGGGGVGFLSSSANYASYTRNRLPLSQAQFNSIIIGVTQYMMRGLPKAPVDAQRDDQKELVGTQVQNVTDAMNRLLFPNGGYYTGIEMLVAAMVDAGLLGDGFIVKEREDPANPESEIIALWYVPFEEMEVVSDIGVPIKHYIYWPRGRVYERADVIHIKNGIGRIPGRGYGPLLYLLEELYGDQMSRRYIGALMGNLGRPSYAIMPRSPDAEMTKKDAEEIEREWDRRVGGDNVGGVMALSGNAEIKPIVFDPNQLDFSGMTNITEARITSALRVDPRVLYLFVGLADANRSTLEYARRLAAEELLEPIWDLAGPTLTHQFLFEYTDNDPNIEIYFDKTKVAALQENADELFARYSGPWQLGLMNDHAVLEAIGQEVPEGSQPVRLIGKGQRFVLEADIAEVATLERELLLAQVELAQSKAQAPATTPPVVEPPPSEPASPEDEKVEEPEEEPEGA